MAGISHMILKKDLFNSSAPCLVEKQNSKWINVGVVLVEEMFVFVPQDPSEGRLMLPCPISAHKAPILHLWLCYYGAPSFIKAKLLLNQLKGFPLQTSSLSFLDSPSFEKRPLGLLKVERVLSYSRSIQCLLLGRALKCKTDGGANKDQRQQPCPSSLLSSHAERGCHRESRPCSFHAHVASFPPEHLSATRPFDFVTPTHSAAVTTVNTYTQGYNRNPDWDFYQQLGILLDYWIYTRVILCVHCCCAWL